MRDLGYDQGSNPPDHQEQHDSNGDVDGAIEPVRNAPVGEEAEQVDVPLVCVRKAIEEDHPERELVQVEQHLAAGLLVEILKPSNQDEIAQKIEEPLREIAHQLPERNLALAPLQQLVSIVDEIHGVG